MGGEIPAPGNFILQTKYIEYEKGNKARMREVAFSKGYGRSMAAWNQEWYLGFLNLSILPAEAQNPAEHEETQIVLMACGLLRGNNKVQLVFWDP